MRLRSSSRGHNTSASVTVTVTVTANDKCNVVVITVGCYQNLLSFGRNISEGICKLQPNTFLGHHTRI